VGSKKKKGKKKKRLRLIDWGGKGGHPLSLFTAMTKREESRANQTSSYKKRRGKSATGMLKEERGKEGAK